MFDLGLDFSLIHAPIKSPTLPVNSGNVPLTLLRNQLDKLSGADELNSKIENEWKNTTQGGRLDFLAQVFVGFAKAAGDEITGWDEIVPSLRRLFLRRSFAEYSKLWVRAPVLRRLKSGRGIGDSAQ